MTIPPLETASSVPLLDEEGYRVALDSLHEGVYITDSDRRILYWNPAAEQISGFAAREVIGRRCRDNILCHVDDSGRGLCLESCPLAHTLGDGAPREAEVYLHHKDGHRIPVMVRVRRARNPGGSGFIAVESFVCNHEAQTLRQQVALLEDLAYIDQLTGLPNRRYLERVLESRLAELGRYGWPFGLLFVDIDEFKAVNDRYGHRVGDQILGLVSRTLESACRNTDTIGRWGGEEFLVVAAHTSKNDLGTLSERIRGLIASSALRRSGDDLSVTVSLGGTSARPEDTVETIVRRADEAMYKSKASGRNRTTLV